MMIKRPGSRSCRSPLRIEQQGSETNSVMYVERNCVWHQQSMCSACIGRIECHRSVLNPFILAVSLCLHAGAAG